MRIEFSYTLADLDEGLIPEAFAKDPRRYRRRITLAAVPMLMVFVMSGSFMWALSREPGKRLAVPHDVVSEMVPNAAAAGFLCVATVLFMWSGWKKARARTPAREGPAKKLTSGQRVLVYLLVLTLAAPLLLLMVRPDWTWNATRDELLLANCAPWAVVFILFLILTAAHTRWAVRQQWFANPAWERPHTIELDETGLRMIDAMSDIRHAWAYFHRAWETPKLLVLQAENQMRYFIPKRVFANTIELEQARAILQNKIATTNFLVSPTGFSVVPKPVLPLDQKEQSSSSV